MSLFNNIKKSMSEALEDTARRNMSSTERMEYDNRKKEMNLRMKEIEYYGQEIEVKRNELKMYNEYIRDIRIKVKNGELDLDTMRTELNKIQILKNTIYPYTNDMFKLFNRKYYTLSTKCEKERNKDFNLINNLYRQIEAAIKELYKELSMTAEERRQRDELKMYERLAKEKAEELKQQELLRKAQEILDCMNRPFNK